MIFEFDNCALDTATHELRRDGALVHVEPQVFAVLAHLAANGDRVVTKIELLDEVWGDRFVSESALTSRIKLARKACGDSGRQQRILKTVHSRGYRFVSPVTVRDDGAPPAGTPTRPVDEPAPAPGRPVGSSRLSTTVFGRERELSQLHDAAHEAFGGSRRAVFVCGGHGTGKSTLVAEFLEQAELDDMLVARGRCIRTRGGVEPYFCLLDALGDLARVEADLVTSTLERVAPTWLAQMPQLVDHAIAERLERRLLATAPNRMLREGVEALAALAHVRPLAVVIDDVHLADGCTLDVLDLLLQRSDPAPLLVIAAGRPDAPDLRQVIDAASTAGHVTLIELEPLGESAVTALAADRLGGDIPPPLADILHRRSGGIPLFAEEIVVAWLRSGGIAVSDGEVSVVQALTELESTIPTTLPPLIERELSTFEADELSVLEACAVAGEQFGAATIAAALERSVAETEEILATLARHRGLVGATGAGSWPDGTVFATYAFTQQLFREVIHDRIPTSRRAALHARVGETLVEHGGRSGEMSLVLAEHFTEAAQPLRAAEQLCVAGELANSRSAHGHATAFLDRALELIDSVPASPERDAVELDVRMELGSALAAAKGWFDPAVADNYQRALELSGDDGHPAEAAAARYGLAVVSELQGQFERTESLLAPLLTIDDGHLAMEAHEMVACSTLHQGSFERSLQTSRAVLETWDDDAHSTLMARIAEHPASSCSSWSSLALWALGHSDESLDLAERAVELGEEHRYALSTAVQRRAMLHQLRTEPGACLEWAQRCRQLGEEQEFVMRKIQADIYIGWALAVTDRAEQGVDLVTDGLARFREVGATLNEAYYLGMQADGMLHADQPARAIDLVDDAMRRATSRTYFYEADLRRLRALGLLALGEFDAARDALDDALGIARRQHAVALELRVLNCRFELESAHGDPDPWRRPLAEVLRRYDGQRPFPDSDRARDLLTG